MEHVGKCVGIQENYSQIIILPSSQENLLNCVSLQFYVINQPHSVWKPNVPSQKFIVAFLFKCNPPEFKSY